MDRVSFGTWPQRAVGLGVVVALTTFVTAPAFAKGTHYLLEGNVGLGSSPYDGEDPGLGVGISVGPTFKLVDAPFRFHVLAGWQSRWSAGSTALGHRLDRTDTALFISERTVLPLFFPLRIYLELGGGLAWADRSSAFGSSDSTLDPYVVTAFGAQLRWVEALSVGLRAAWEPIHGQVSALDPRSDAHARLSLNLTVGAHF